MLIWIFAHNIVIFNVLRPKNKRHIFLSETGMLLRFIARSYFIT